jgi:hypothetical protein
MWLIIAIVGVIVAIIGRIKEYKDENFIGFKRLSLLLAAVCSINFIHAAIIYKFYFTNGNWSMFLEFMQSNAKNVLICIVISIFINFVPISIFRK